MRLRISKIGRFNCCRAVSADRESRHLARYRLHDTENQVPSVHAVLTLKPSVVTSNMLSIRESDGYYWSIVIAV
jgi:hypothetical protein